MKRRPNAYCSRYSKDKRILDWFADSIPYSKLLAIIKMGCNQLLMHNASGYQRPTAPSSGFFSLLFCLQVDSQVLLAYCSYEEAQFLFRQAAEVGLLGPGYIWILPSLAVGNPDSPPPDSFPVGVIGVITDQWRKSLRQRVREGVAIVAKGAESFKKQYGFIPEGHGDCSKPSKHSDNHTLFR